MDTAQLATNSSKNSSAVTISSGCTKKRQRGPVVRVACNRCRAQKLKCSGEMSPGCQRCRSRRRSCHYDSSAITNNTSYVDAAPAGTMSAEVPVSPRHVDQDMDFESPDVISQYMLVSEQSFAHMSSEPSDVFSADSLNCFFGEMYPSRADKLEHPALTDGFFETGDTKDRPDPCRKVKTSCIPGEVDCGCLQLAMSTHADASMNLLWAVRTALIKASPQPIEVLSCLKKTLETHDILLGCPVHRSQPNFTALFASTCNMMLGGLEYLVTSQGPPPPSATTTNFFEGTTMSEGTTPSPESEGWHRDSVSAEAPSGRISRIGQDGGNLSIVYVNNRQLHQSDVKVSQLVLDSDDEIHVLRGLLASRTKHLANLLERLYALVGEAGEPVHKEIFLSYQGRLRRLLTRLAVNEPF